MIQIIQAGQYLYQNGPQLIAAITGVFSALCVLFMLVPGEQPEKTLQAIVAFLSKFSRK